MFLVYIGSLHASELKVEPIYSIERTLRAYPAPSKMVTNYYLGLKAIYGVPLISAEFEVAQSTRVENFPDEGKKVDFTNQRIMLGFRSYPYKTKYVGLYFRGGARAKKEIRETTENGSSTLSDSGIDLDPYAGVGLTVEFGKTFSMNAGSTLAYNKNASDSDDQYDVINTLSFSMKAGK